MVVDICEKNNENCVRCNRVNDASLDPAKGKLRCRLVFGGTEQLKHNHKKSGDNSLCALHRWRYGRENENSKVKKDVMLCEDCLVNLCVPCWSLFHSISSVKQLKRAVDKGLKKKATGKGGKKRKR